MNVVPPNAAGAHNFNGSSENFSDISSMIRLSAEMQSQIPFIQQSHHHQPQPQMPAVVQHNLMPSSGPSRVCPICNSEFSKESGLKRHMRVHNNSTRNTAPAPPLQHQQHPVRLPFACNICHIPFHNASDLKCHMEVQHHVYGTAQVQKCTQCGCFRPVTTMCVTNPFRCGNCAHQQQNHQHPPSNGFHQSAFSSTATTIPNSLTNRERATFPVDVPAAQRAPPPPVAANSGSRAKPLITATSASGSTLVKPMKPHKCPDCPKSFAHANTLTLHKKTHTGEYKDICEYCDKTFVLHDYYIRHLRVHTKEKPYKCDVCEKCFSQSNTLTQHMRTHTGEKPYSCDDCGKSFGVRDYLNKHRRVHTGEKPYECDVCTKRYSQASALRSHKLQHSHFAS